MAPTIELKLTQTVATVDKC